MDNTPDSFRRFLNLKDAYKFARAHCGTCRRPGERNRVPSWYRSARDLLALQEGLGSGDYRVRIEEDPDVDTSFDETSETNDKLNDGTWLAVGVVLERRDTWRNELTGETEDRWMRVDSLWGCIGPARDPHWQACAADMFPST